MPSSVDRQETEHCTRYGLDLFYFIILFFLTIIGSVLLEGSPEDHLGDRTSVLHAQPSPNPLQVEGWSKLEVPTRKVRYVQGHRNAMLMMYSSPRKSHFHAIGRRQKEQKGGR